MAVASDVPDVLFTPVDIPGIEISEDHEELLGTATVPPTLEEGGPMLAVATDQAFVKGARRKGRTLGTRARNWPGHHQPMKEAIRSLVWLLPYTRHNLLHVVAIIHEWLSQFCGSNIRASGRH